MNTSLSVELCEDAIAATEIIVPYALTPIEERE